MNEKKDFLNEKNVFGQNSIAAIPFYDRQHISWVVRLMNEIFYASEGKRPDRIEINNAQNNSYYTITAIYIGKQYIFLSDLHAFQTISYAQIKDVYVTAKDKDIQMIGVQIYKSEEIKEYDKKILAWVNMNFKEKFIDCNENNSNKKRQRVEN